MKVFLASFINYLSAIFNAKIKNSILQERLTFCLFALLRVRKSSKFYYQAFSILRRACTTRACHVGCEYKEFCYGTKSTLRIYCWYDCSEEKISTRAFNYRLRKFLLLRFFRSSKSEGFLFNTDIIFIALRHHCHKAKSPVRGNTL